MDSVEIEQSKADRLRYVGAVREPRAVDARGTREEAALRIHHGRHGRDALIVIEVEPAARHIGDVGWEEAAGDGPAAVRMIDREVQVA